MKSTARVPVTAGLMALFLFPATGCQRLRANDQLNKGVAAFKNTKYEEATNHFQQAVAIDPDNINARLYLATTYSSQVVPNLDSPDNNRLAQNAIKGFNDVLQKDPANLTALEQLASLYRETGKTDTAREFEHKVLAVDSNNADAYYALGQMDWKQAFDNAQAVLKSQGITNDDDAGNIKLSKDNCAKLSAENAAPINESIGFLKKAVAINDVYDDAMSYLALDYRRKADIECGNDPARKADLDQADQWTKKSLGARKEIERRKEAKEHGVTQ